MAFQKAVKHDSRGRIALVGPSGSGKSFTALEWGTFLAGLMGKRVAAIDTEHGSLSKYADRFDFDVDEPNEYTQKYILSALSEAENSGDHGVFLVDSLSHFWIGKGGTMEFVDQAARKAANGGKADSWTGWKAWSKLERELVDRFIASPLHIIVTMRVKTEYQEEVNDRGKKVRKKIGLAPVQREGLEYEFDLVGSMDEENNLTIDKSRCSPLMEKKFFEKPGRDVMETFSAWLKGVERTAPSKPAQAVQRAQQPHAQQQQQPAANTPAADSGLRLEDFDAEGQTRLLYCMRRVVGYNEAQARRWLAKFQGTAQQALDYAEAKLVAKEEEERQNGGQANAA